MQIIKLAFTLLLLMLSVQSQAAIFSKITKSSTSSGNSTYNYIISSWDYADETPNPCYKLPVCYIAISHRHNDLGGGGYPTTVWTSKGVPCVSTSQNIGELGECLATFPSNRKGEDHGEVGVRLVTPYSGTAGHSGSTILQECVGIFWSTALPSGAFGGNLLPGSVCGIAPPPVGACGMPDAIMLDHGSLAADSIEGNVAQQNIFIDCNKPIDGRLFLEGINNGSLALGSGISSTIKLNGTPLDSTGVNIPLKTGANLMNITSTLTSSGKPVEGEHIGQGVLILALN